MRNRRAQDHVPAGPLVADAFREPKIGIHKAYTRTGDDGKTALVDGTRVPKDDLRIEAYGAVDELNSIVGLAQLEAHEAGLVGMATDLRRVQHQLFNLGSILATPMASQGAQQPRVRDQDVAWLEQTMDAANKDLPALTSFILPGGSRLNGLLHLARTVCRRAERIAVTLRRDDGCTEVEVRYLNRLSDAFFVWARQAAHEGPGDEVLWRPDSA